MPPRDARMRVAISFRGFVRECNGEDPGRRKAIGRDALNDRGRQGGRLAGAGTGENQNRAGLCGGFGLGLGESGGQSRDRRGRVRAGIEFRRGVIPTAEIVKRIGEGFREFRHGSVLHS